MSTNPVACVSQKGDLEKVRMRKIRDCGLILLFLVFFFGISFSVYADEPFELHVLDVGQGQSVLIKADGHYMLIDGGGRDASSFVVSYLKQQGVGKLDCAAVSHYDEDHMAGLIGVLEVFPCDIFLVPSYEGNGELYQSMATAALSNGCVIMHGKAGMEFPLGNAEGEIIGPVRTDYSSDNDMSLCFKMSFGDRICLICGDAELNSERDLVAEGVDLKADLYVVSHHGSSTSSTEGFLDAVSPSYAVISCGRDNSYGHPAMEVMQRLKDHGTDIYRTDKQGTVTAYSDGQNLWFDERPSDNETGSSTFVSLDMEDVESDNPLSRQISAQTKSFLYVCNTNTGKFHYPNCDSVNQMKDDNRLNTSLDRDELIEEGYVPCGNCNP